MFERFTERARQVVVLAQEEARSKLLKHDYIGTEHLLLGLLREEQGLAAHVLRSFDITIERARVQIVRIVGPGQEVSSGQIPFTPRAKAVLEAAIAESRRLGHSYVGTEHVLLGLIGNREAVATRILRDCDADTEKIRAEVMRMLAGPTGRRRSAVAAGPPQPARRVQTESEQSNPTTRAEIDPEPDAAVRSTAMTVTEARALAVQAHSDQRDRDGSFHIAHVARVAETVPADDSQQRVAWLHDVVEDSQLSFSDLVDRLAGDELEALRLLTHDDPNQTYEAYVEAIVGAPGEAGVLARTIKQADLLDNLARCARDRDPAVSQYGLALGALWTRHSL